MRIWLKKIREENGLTQQDVAELADVERTTYASIEQGRRNPSVVNAMRIASVLDFEWTIFFDDKVRKKSHFYLNEKQEVRK
ncbi:helix-turn-helix transcriptional regulator [Listeria monocytogenes]|nr:XRE family transcriptional regulator [Listeria monocytogenes]EGP3531426.1 helix-turn-helix transcriptional regulator [Listeria monocytogenes]HAA2265934.1 XRE family transcriptional regulator [Listeria monocytogenes]HAA5710122.1 XRE family transcriptional regulator [Listeria monocytogenes]HEL7118788.1 helix-turn-helix transcriptional regulator [Listeria monocytogenes]